ncbi:alpha-methyldopa hypersensitive protein-like [Copidosoma floridanum]|uniref:alpha-methyldopa hypersensitive protein-like n=1 Tax=Copidosoma floridanum TaxID=29053 RepID=UPI0006C9CC2D|nr:alpha-methyldopa hypersensitive protein-like [Copidosoma floridanum]
MDDKEFREFGKAMVDYIADYTENVRDREVLPHVKPGYLCDLIPKEAPQKSESWRQILDDVEKCIMPGMTHWSSPHFHAYYPTANSYPAVVGELLSAGIGCIGFSWICSPACTELEVITMDWLGKMLGLPEEFLNSHDGPGGGVLQVCIITIVNIVMTRHQVASNSTLVFIILQSCKVKWYNNALRTLKKFIHLYNIEAHKLAQLFTLDAITQLTLQITPTLVINYKKINVKVVKVV